MGYNTNGLTFNTLRAGNQKRLPEFRNNKGELSHTGFNDWSLNDWATAVTGELGEACNILKKVRRGDLSLEEARPKLTQEFADVVIYMDLLAAAAGIDLGKAVMETFNTKSVKVNSRVRLVEDDWYFTTSYHDKT